MEKIDIQKIGNYYIVPIDDLKDEYKNDFDEEEKSVSLLEEDLYMCKTLDNIEFDFYDEDLVDDYIEDLMSHKKYHHYLVALFSAKWNGASGVKIFNDYKECFYRDYECSMYVDKKSSHKKWVKLREYHHDKPLGHNSIIIGLTDNEYKKMKNKNIYELLEYARGF